MRMPRSKPNAEQLELLDADADAPRADGRRTGQHESAVRSTRSSTRASASDYGRPLVVPLRRLYEDQNNPRTEFPDAELDELTDDIRRHGILQPIVVHPVDAAGLYRIHFGAKRLRAAARAGLQAVPVVVLYASGEPVLISSVAT